MWPSHARRRTVDRPDLAAISNLSFDVQVVRQTFCHENKYGGFGWKIFVDLFTN